MPGWPGLISVDLAQDEVRRAELGLPEITSNGFEQVALGASQVTDMFLLGIAGIPKGLDLTPLGASRKGAWYSLAFLLREAGVRYLDVQSRELQAGLRVYHIGGKPYGQVFLADDLENGAGYATHLGTEEGFEGLLSEARDYIGLLERAAHANDCDSSCYDCLRDYYNMAYHPLLDWRLGRDMLDLVSGDELNIGRWTQTEKSLAEGFAANFEGTVLTLDGDVTAVAFPDALFIIKHPLESASNPAQRLALAVADAEDRDFGELGSRPYYFTDSFTVLRRPGAARQGSLGR